MKKYLMLIFLFFIVFYSNTYNAMSADELRGRISPCSNIELASANPDGSVTSLSCHDDYNSAKVILDSVANDNIIMIEAGRVIDAKYALIDYDFSTTNGYINVYSDVNLSSNLTYIRGGDSDDAVFLGVDYNTKRIKIKVSGAVGWITKYDSNNNLQYDIVPLSWCYSPSYYKITSTDIIHVLPKNVYNTKGSYSLTIGKKPTMVNTGNFYSYDGNYFYTDLKLMITDYKNDNYNNAVNKDNPYYNYYQYISFRTRTNYSVANINQYIASRTNANSKLRNMGDYFIAAQDKYGVNVIVMLAIAMNESGLGTSSIAINKNNIFGLNAVDATPGQSADYFASVEQCIYDFAYAWLSYGYLQPGDYSGRFNGASFGNKQFGLNIKYASDPYWGEKAAAYYYDIDKYFSYQDYSSNTLAILNSNYSNTVYPKKTPGGLNVSSSFYQYKVRNSVVNVVGEVSGPAVNGNTTWYKIMSDPVLDGNLEYSGSSKSNPRVEYNYNAYIYVPAAYFTKIFTGTTNTDNGGNNNNPDNNNPDNNNPEPPAPDPVYKAVSQIVSEAGYQYGSGIVTGIKVNTDVNSLKEILTSKGGTVEITDGSGNQASGKLGTGYKVSITSGTTEVLTVVIYGDTDGDGAITAVDYARVKNYIMSSSGLDNEYLLAADVDRDGTVSAVDYTNIKNYIMGNNSVIN